MGGRPTEARTLGVFVHLTPILHTEALTLFRIPSGIGASLLEPPDAHEHPVPIDRNSAGREPNTPLPCPVQTGVCPESRSNYTSQTAIIRVTQGYKANNPAAAIPLQSLDAENAFPEGKEDPPHSSWATSSKTPAWMHNANATADLSPYNGTSAILAQHEACPECDDNEQTRHVTTPSVRASESLRSHIIPPDLVHGPYDTSLTYISNDVVLFWLPPWSFFKRTPSSFTVDLVEYNCGEQFMTPQKLAYSATNCHSRRYLLLTIHESKNASAIEYRTSIMIPVSKNANK